MENLYLAMQQCESLSGYDLVREQMVKNAGETKDSEPALAAKALFEPVDNDTPLLRLNLGGTVYVYVPPAMQHRLKEWQKWESLCRSSGEAVPPPANYGGA